MADYFGTPGNDSFVGTIGNDSFYMQTGGDDDVDGDAGNDGFFFGAALNSLDVIRGGSGVDTLAIQGNYGPVAPTLKYLTGLRNDVEVLLLLSGTDTRFGGPGNLSHDYHMVAVDTNVIANGFLTVQASDLETGEDLTFDGSAETDGGFRIFAGQGTDILTGGSGSDGFLFGADRNFQATDRVIGGDGNGLDSVAFRGNYTGADALVFSFQQILGVEFLVFLSGLTKEFGGVIVPGGFDYDVTLDSSFGALGQQIRADTLGAGESLRLDATATNGVFLRSGAGDDVLIGRGTYYAGGGNDLIQTSVFSQAYGEGGDDVIELPRIANTVVDGGSGMDTLRLAGFDQVDISFQNAVGIEKLEIQGTGFTYELAAEVLQAGIRTIQDISAGGNTIDASEMLDASAIVTIDGGAGADTISVGAVQSTILVYDALSDSSGAARDIVNFFLSGTDKIDARGIAPALDEIDFRGSVNGFAAAQAALVAGDQDLDVVYDTAAQTLWFNLDDNGVLDGNDLSIVLSGVASIQGSDVYDGFPLI